MHELTGSREAMGSAHVEAATPVQPTGDEHLLLLAAGELHPLYDRVMRWQEAGRPTPRPLTEAELRLLQARGQGAAVRGRPLPAYIAETYRAFCLWYHRAVMAPRG